MEPKFSKKVLPDGTEIVTLVKETAAVTPALNKPPAPKQEIKPKKI